MTCKTQHKAASDTRAKLVKAGIKLFIAFDYEQITTRQIAAEAGCNIGMIRYYFNNKLGLFEAVLGHFHEQMQVSSKKMQQNIAQASLADILHSHCQLFTPYPDFPKLIFRVMSGDNQALRQQVLQSLFTTLPSTMDELIIALQERGELKADLDPKMVRISLLSLMVFPFILPPAMLELHDIELSSSFINQLSHHNQELLRHGFSTAS